MEQQIARIALSGVPYSADKLYSYLVPPELADACRAGVRVSVPFGRGNRRTEGFVLETLCETADKPLKPVFTVLDEQPLLDTSLLRLATARPTAWRTVYRRATCQHLPRRTERISCCLRPSPPAASWIAASSRSSAARRR